MSRKKGLRGAPAWFSLEMSSRASTESRSAFAARQEPQRAHIPTQHWSAHSDPAGAISLCDAAAVVAKQVGKRYGFMLADTKKLILGSPGTKVSLNMKRGGEEFDVRLVRTAVGSAHSASVGRPQAALSGSTLAEEVDAALPGSDEVGAVDVACCGWPPTERNLADQNLDQNLAKAPRTLLRAGFEPRCVPDEGETSNHARASTLCEAFRFNWIEDKHLTLNPTPKTPNPQPTTPNPKPYVSSHLPGWREVVVFAN